MAQVENPGGSTATRARGFAKMDPQKQREIASKGGRAAHERGTAHEFDANEAREAGRKGGQTVSRNRAHMAEIGRRGGEASGGRRGRAALMPDHSPQPLGESGTSMNGSLNE